MRLLFLTWLLWAHVAKAQSVSTSTSGPNRARHDPNGIHCPNRARHDPDGIHCPNRARHDLDYQTSVFVHVPTHTLRGATRIRVGTQTGASLQTPGLWVYSEKLSQPPSAMDRNAARWVFPSAVSLGNTQVHAVRIDNLAVPMRWQHRRHRVDTRDTFGMWMPFAFTDSSTPHTIDIEWTLKLPERFGRLGYIHDLWTLAAPWHPLFVDAASQNLPNAHHRVTLRVQGAAGWHALLGPQLSQVPDLKTIVASARGAYIPIMLSRNWYRYVRPIDDGHARMVLDSPYTLFENKRERRDDVDVKSFPPSPDGRDAFARDLRDINRIPTIQLLKEATRDVIGTLTTLGQHPPPDWHIVIMPSRLEISGHAESWTWVSDRAYEILPLKETMVFHTRSIKRALFRWHARRKEIDDNLPFDSWQQETRAELWLNMDDARKHARSQKVKDLIGFAAFHPVVDQLIYAPQMAFVDAYFGAATTPDRYRDDPHAAWSAHMHGRIVARNLAMHLKASEWQGCLERSLLPDHDLSVECGVPQLISTWLKPHEGKINYAVKLDASRKTLGPDGKTTLYRTKLHISQHRMPIHSPERIDPIGIRLETRKGQSIDYVYDPAIQTNAIEVTTEAEVERVEIDPNGELFEDPAFAHEHPRKDNATSQPWRMPLLQNFDASFSGPDGQFEGFVETALRKRFNLEDAWVIRLERSVRSLAATGRYVRRFGPKVHLNRRSGYVSFGLGASHLRRGFMDAQGSGHRLDAIFGLGWDSRDFFSDPRQGLVIDFSSRWGVVRRDNGNVTTSATLRAAAGVLVPLDLRQTLVGIANTAYVLGDPLAQELSALGGPSLLRGIQQNALLGRGRLIGVLEHRWTVVGDLAWNLLHYAWIRELQIVSFLGGGVLFDTYDRSRSHAASAGGGLRLQVDYGGVQPGLLALDVGVPLQRERTPIGLYFGFEQYF